MSNIEKLEEELKQAKDRILKIETYFKIGLAVAVIFGLVGSFGASLISDVKSEIVLVQKSTKKVIEEVKEAKTNSINEIASKERKSLKELAELESMSVKSISTAKTNVILEINESASNAIQNALDLQIPDIKKWPDGSYCILRGSTSCPAHFNQIDSKLHALSVYDKTSTNINGARFGSSSIGLHNSGNSAKWYGDINLSVCCK